MKKRLCALLLAFCMACAALAVPASAAGSSNTAVQAAVMLGSLDSGQDASAALTRGRLAQLLTAFSAWRESTGGSAGTLFTDVDGTDPLASGIRTAVQQGWMSGYSDGSFRPDQAVTLEEACAAALSLLGYDVTTLSGTFPDAQLNKARELGLREGLSAGQGDTLTIAQGAQLLYNALTAVTAEGETYGTTLGLAVTDASVVIGHGTSGCDTEARAEIVARMEKGGTTTYTICSSCGDVNGESCLSGIDNAFANFGGLEAYTGVLDNGQRVMALGCIEGGAAIENVEANVEMPASYVEGYTLYQVGENGETKVDVSVRQGIAYFTVNMQDGAALLEMVKE